MLQLPPGQMNVVMESESLASRQAGRGKIGIQFPRMDVEDVRPAVAKHAIDEIACDAVRHMPEVAATRAWNSRADEFDAGWRHFQ